MKKAILIIILGLLVCNVSFAKDPGWIRKGKLKYFYFKLKEEGSESSESIGIFPTKKECEYYSNLFRSKNIGLTSNCKKGFSPA